MKKLSGFLVIMIAFSAFSQTSSLAVNTYYRDFSLKPIVLSSKPFMPKVVLKNIATITSNNDTDSISKFLSRIKKHFCDQYLFEVHDERVHLYFSPIINFQLGQNWLDNDGSTLYQNTRGIYVKGTLLKNFSFSTAFVENQARFSDYENHFISNHGEFYPNASTVQQNGVIPGGGRTKPFKDGGYDYGYAIGSFLYQPFKNLEIRAGNAPTFVGSGYRSLILSDNSYQAPYIDIKYTFLKKWSYGIRKARGFNLIRKTAFSTVEGYYQPKAYSRHYLNFEINSKITVGLSENSIWSMGDTLSKPPNGRYYAPIPFLGLSQSSNETIYGIDASEIVGKKTRFYQQFVFSGFNLDQIGLQFGLRFYDLLPNSLLQIEYNKVGSDLYTAELPGMSYTHYNLPLAHPKGQGFDELVIRANVSIKRIYGEIKTVCYWLKNYNERDLLPMDNEGNAIEDRIIHQQFELGYRINPKINFCFFGRTILRISDNDPTQILLHIGLSTNLFNSYNDY
jgi:hypothetical protein